MCHQKIEAHQSKSVLKSEMEVFIVDPNQQNNKQEQIDKASYETPTFPAVICLVAHNVMLYYQRNKDAK